MNQGEICLNRCIFPKHFLTPDAQNAEQNGNLDGSSTYAMETKSELFKGTASQMEVSALLPGIQVRNTISILVMDPCIKEWMPMQI